MQCNVLFFSVLSNSQKVRTAWNSKELHETYLERVAPSVEYFLFGFFFRLWAHLMEVQLQLYISQFQSDKLIWSAGKAHADTAKVKTLTLGQNVDTWKSQLEPKI